MVAATAATAVCQAQTPWQTNLASAQKLAAKLHKPVFVDFFAEWCGPCKMLDKNVFPDSRVRQLLDKAVCVHLDIDKNEDLARKYSVTSIPRLMLFSSDGSQTFWDTMGYRDPDEFAQEFSEALHLKVPIATAAPVIEPAPLVKVRAALATAGGLSRLQATDPASAREGMRMLVEKLGVFNESDFQPTATLLKSAGNQALPALLQGMDSKTLAVRVGSYKVAQAILSKRHPAFDPWSPKPKRTTQLAAWRRTLGL